MVVTDHYYTTLSLVVTDHSVTTPSPLRGMAGNSMESISKVIQGDGLHLHFFAIPVVMFSTWSSRTIPCPPHCTLGQAGVATPRTYLAPWDEPARLLVPNEAGGEAGRFLRKRRHFSLRQPSSISVRSSQRTSTAIFLLRILNTINGDTNFRFSVT